MFYVALICTVIGIIALYFISLVTGFVFVKDISLDMIDSKVKVKGFVSSLNEKGDVLMFKLEDSNSSVDVVYFTSGYFNKIDSLSSYVEVRGTVKEWNGGLEIMADEVLNIN